jgi:hypothetical protein
MRGASDAEGLKISTTSSDFTRAFYVESMNKLPVNDLRISVADFVGPDSQLAETRWTVDGKPGPTPAVQIPGLGSLKVDISARLVKEGPYTGSISLIYNDKRWPVPIVVTRSRQAPTIKIQELLSIRAASLWNANPELWMTIEETGGASFALAAPKVTALALKEGDKAKVQAQFRRIDVLDDNGKPAGDSLAIGPNQAKQVKIRISTLKGTGEFSGTVRVSAADFAPVEQAFTIFVKKSWLIAALFICLGVVPSYLLKLYYKKDRPRMLLLRRAFQLSRDMESMATDLNPPTDSERAILDSFRSRLQKLYSDLEADTEKEPDKLLEEIAGKLTVFPLFVNARRRLDAVQPQEIVKTLRETLNAVAKKLMAEKTAQQDVDTLRTDLLDLDAAITTTVRDNLLARLKELQADVDEQIKNSSVDLGDRLRKEVSPRIEAGREKANANDLAVARSEFDAARKIYACVLAEELRTRVASEETPQGILQPEWEKLVESVKTYASEACLETTGPDRAAVLYQEAYSQYLKAVISALRKRAQGGITSVGANTTMTEDVKKDFQKRLSDILTKLDGAIGKLQENQLRGAFQDYTAARNDVEKVAEELQKAGTQMGFAAAGKQAGSAAQPGATIPAPVSEQNVVRMAERNIRIDDAIGKLTSRVKWLDFIFMIIVLCISVLLGLKLLWVDDPTWGGAKAYLAALLWGLGLYQVSGAAFEGAAGLIEKWSK